ncbi:hypothetical protein B0H10DRAFT_1941762 [Mycena sp. CBHHK59/15]|nr:hypothetical protein B0H10DRAFT_1941762 [Mycena sp. CBHHK59/15]
MSAKTPLKQVNGLWFLDGNIILHAEDNIFHVDCTVLTKKSSPPTSCGDSEYTLIEGNPVVCLYDSATDIETLLRALFDSSYFMPTPAAADFHTALVILRISDKYDVDSLCKCALLHLETVYPVDLMGYHNIAANTLQYKSRTESLVLDLKAISTLLEVGATWLLPVVYYSIGAVPALQLISAGKSWDNLSVTIVAARQPLRRAPPTMHQRKTGRLDQRALGWISAVRRYGEQQLGDNDN